MAETTKNNLDLDFSDISAKTPEVKSVEEVKNPLEQQVTAKAPPPPKMTEVVICIPAGQSQWVTKDLAECTGEEFLRWAKAYFPQVTATPDRFESLPNKIRAYEKVKNWHASMMRDKVRDSVN